MAGHCLDEEVSPLFDHELDVLHEDVHDDLVGTRVLKDLGNCI